MTEFISALFDWTGKAVIAMPLTLGTYAAAFALFRAGRSTPLLNPVLLGVVMVIVVLLLSNVAYVDYFDGAKPLHFLLGTATVALALPLHAQLSRLRKQWLPIVTSICGGAIAAAVSALLTAYSMGATTETMLSLLPKSTTTPVAMSISAQLGGMPALTAAAVILTGIIGAVFGVGFLALFKLRDDEIAGLALGVSAHGIGTARALQLSPRLGAYSGLAMGISALVTALICPLLWYLFNLLPG